MPNTQPTPFTLANINAFEREFGQHAIDRVRELAAISPDVIAAIIASGPLNTSDEFVGAAINSYADRVDGDAVDDIAGDAIAGKDITDALSEITMYASEAGYMLGLAVGMALGSGQPFTGAARQTPPPRERILESTERRVARKAAQHSKGKRHGLRKGGAR